MLERLVLHVILKKADKYTSLKQKQSWTEFTFIHF